jgi:hypothetical protein
MCIGIMEDTQVGQQSDIVIVAFEREKAARGVAFSTGHMCLLKVMPLNPGLSCVR